MSVTAGLAQDAIQPAIYTVLAGDATLAALSCGSRIYDAVPENTQQDFVAIGEWTENTDDTLEDNNPGIGADCTLTIHVYTDDGDSSGEGYKNAQAIASRIKLLLHDVTLTLTGWTCVLCQHQDTVALRDEDLAGNPKRHLISTYRIVAEAT